MSQAIGEKERGRGPSKPSFDAAQPKLDLSKKTETTPRDAGILVSSAALTEQIENGVRAVGGETPAQLTLKTWLAELVQKNYLPYLGQDTIGALAFRISAIDKTAGLVHAKPNFLQTLLGQDGESAYGTTKVIGGQWKTNDVLIALRLPIAETSKINRTGLVQAGIFRQAEGDTWWRMLKAGPHTQNVTTLINLMFGLNSFGIEGNKENLKDTAKLTLPGGFPGQKLAHANFLRILQNHYFNGEITGPTSPLNLIPLAKF